MTAPKRLPAATHHRTPSRELTKQPRSGILGAALDVFLREGRPAEKSLKKITVPDTSASSQRFGFNHVDFLNKYLAGPAKVRHKP